MHRKTCARALSVVVEDRAHVHVDGLHRAERALDVGQALVGGHRRSGVELLCAHAGADHVQAVERSFLRDHLVPALPGEGGVGDRQLDVLGHVEALDHAAHSQGDGLLAA